MGGEATEAGEPAHGTDGQSVLEDVTGFNFRSIKTIKDLFIRPNAVFRAYAARDRESYGAPVRIWLGLIGLQVIVSFLYGGQGAVLAEQFAAMEPEVRNAAEGVLGDLDAFADAYGDVSTVLHPVIVGGFTALSLFFLMPLQKKIGWPVRLNLTFAILVAGSVVGLLMMIPMALGRGFSGWTIAPVFLTYFVTYVRGAPGVLAETRGSAVGKGLVFAAGMLLLVLVGAIVLFAVSAIIAVAMIA